MAAFHGLDGFAPAVVAIDTLIAVALLSGFTQASAWMQGRVMVGLALFVPSAALLGDFLGAATLVALLARQLALVTLELRKVFRPAKRDRAWIDRPHRWHSDCVSRTGLACTIPSRWCQARTSMYREVRLTGNSCQTRVENSARPLDETTCSA